MGHLSPLELVLRFLDFLRAFIQVSLGVLIPNILQDHTIARFRVLRIMQDFWYQSAGWGFWNMGCGRRHPRSLLQYAICGVQQDRSVCKGICRVYFVVIWTVRSIGLQLYDSCINVSITHHVEHTSNANYCWCTLSIPAMYTPSQLLKRSTTASTVLWRLPQRLKG